MKPIHFHLKLPSRPMISQSIQPPSIVTHSNNAPYLPTQTNLTKLLSTITSLAYLLGLPNQSLQIPIQVTSLYWKPYLHQNTTPNDSRKRRMLTTSNPNHYSMLTSLPSGRIPPNLKSTPGTSSSPRNWRINLPAPLTRMEPGPLTLNQFPKKHQLQTTPKQPYLHHCPPNQHAHIHKKTIML